MTYNIAFVQPNFQQGPKELNAYYLPYSAGVVWSYAAADSWIKENFEVSEWVWRRDEVEPIAQRLAKSNIVAFSCYVWNHNYNFALAQRIKEINPNVFTVWGGPEVAITDKDLFRKNPFMDIVVCFEGEITFKNLLKAYPIGKFDNIPGLLINDNGNIINTGDAKRIESLTDVQSPYLTGVFDQLIKDNPGII
jgi:radical SAM superfamily enzyme YgiQ (UPF0313 family)